MRSPGFFRRLAIITYDSLLLIAILFLATALILPLNGGEAFTTSQYLFPAYLLSVSFFYYGWFWTHGGQTLGMKTWKIKIQTFDRQDLSWQHAFKRFIMAIFSWGIFGIGFLWQIVDKQRYTWHDHYSKTMLYFDEQFD